MGKPETSPIGKNSAPATPNASAANGNISQPLTVDVTTTPHKMGRRTAPVTPNFVTAVTKVFQSASLTDSTRNPELERNAHNTKILLLARTDDRTPFKDDDGYLNFRTRRNRKQPDRYVPEFPPSKRRAMTPKVETEKFSGARKRCQSSRRSVEPASSGKKTNHVSKRDNSLAALRRRCKSVG